MLIIHLRLTTVMGLVPDHGSLTTATGPVPDHGSAGAPNSCNIRWAVCVWALTAPRAGACWPYVVRLSGPH